MADSKHNRLKYIWYFLGAAVFIIACFFGYWHIWWDRFGVPESPGTAGDMFGGLTSLFTGLAFAGVIVTMLMQNEDLRLQRKELEATRLELQGQKEQLIRQNDFIEKQNFETAFFQLVRQFNDLISQISVGAAPDIKTGREALERIFVDFQRNVYPLRMRFPGNEELEQKNRNEDKKIRNDRVGLIETYNAFYDQNNDDLGSYFRTLYNIVKFVDESYIEDKEFFINIIRAQLSSSECGLLLFNGLGKYGHRKMKPYIERYNLLEHLPKGIREEFCVLFKDYKIECVEGK